MSIVRDYPKYRVFCGIKIYLCKQYLKCTYTFWAIKKHAWTELLRAISIGKELYAVLALTDIHKHTLRKRLSQTACDHEFRICMMFNKQVKRNKQWKRTHPLLTLTDTQPKHMHWKPLYQTACNRENRSLSCYSAWMVKHAILCQNAFGVQYSHKHINTVSCVINKREQLSENRMCISILDPENDGKS